MKCIQHVNLAAGSPLVFCCLPAEDGDTQRYDCDFWSESRRRHDTTISRRQSISQFLSWFTNFQILHSNYAGSFMFWNAFCILSPPSSSLSSSAAQLGLALRPEDSFATPRCVGDRFSLRLRWLHLWKGLQAVDKQIASLTDWLSVCLSFFTICMICQGAPHSLCLVVPRRVCENRAPAESTRCSAIFPVSQLSFPLFRLNWLSCGSKVLHQDKNQQYNKNINWQAGDFLLLFFLFSRFVFFALLEVSLIYCR